MGASLRPLPQQNVSLSQLVNDLFGIVAFLGIVQISLYGFFATLELDEDFGASSTAWKSVWVEYVHVVSENFRTSQSGQSPISRLLRG